MPSRSSGAKLFQLASAEGHWSPRCTTARSNSLSHAGSQSRVVPSSRPTGPTPALSRRAAPVTATDATVKVSGYVADRVGNLTKRMASYLAAKVVDPNKPGGIKKGGSAMGTLVDAARGGLVAYGTVYNGLEANAKVLGNNLKQNSVKVVQHKYGNQAGDEFGKACTAAGNAAMTYMNVQSLGAKGLVKKTAKNTGKNIAKNIVGMGSQEKKEVTQEEIKQ